MLFFRWRETPAPTDASHGAPLQRWSIPRWYLTSQWEAPILVRAGWALFFSLVILISVEKGKQRYNKATEGDQQADHPYEYQNDICSCHWRHLPSYVFRQAGHWLGRLPPLSWVPWMDSTIIWQGFQPHPFWSRKSSWPYFQCHISVTKKSKMPEAIVLSGFRLKCPLFELDIS